MKNAFKIFAHDLKTIATNVSAFIVVAALCLLPSLYAWFNIKASWDPYSKDATSGILIGVVNEDAGADFNGEQKNLGKMIVEELKENEQLGWQFTDKETAADKIRNGKYFATITIPSNFSEKLLSITTTAPEPGELIYTVNEKINAIAPKLTDKGATSLQLMISKEITKTISTILLEMSKEFETNLKTHLPEIEQISKKLNILNDDFPMITQKLLYVRQTASKISSFLTQANKALPGVESTLNNMQSFSTTFKEYAEKADTAKDQLLPVIKKQVELAVVISDASIEIAQRINDSLNNIPTEDALKLIDALSLNLSFQMKLNSTLQSVILSFEDLSDSPVFTALLSQLQTKEDRLSAALTSLSSLRTQIENGNPINQDIYQQFLSVLNDINAISKNLSDNFDELIAARLTNAVTKLNEAIDLSSSIIAEANNKLPTIENYSVLALKGLKEGEDNLDAINKQMPEVQNKLGLITEKFNQLKEDNSLKNLIALLDTDITKRVDYLENPITLKEERLFPIANYGTGMTPFYSVLSFWVGLLLLSSVLSVNSTLKASSTENYFGKLFLYSLIAVIQALIVSLGDLYLLKITCLHPAMFLANNLLIGLVFAVIVYSLVSVFGNVGKVIGIILLVLQVAGSGGTFPIQLTPPFFQKLNPFLPFTYAISLNREAIGGIVPDVIYKDYLILGIFVIISITLSVFLKKPFNQLMKPFTKKFHESGLE